MVRTGYLEGALNFTTKIPINLEIGVCMCVVGTCKLIFMVCVGYIEGDLNFTTKLPIIL